MAEKKHTAQEYADLLVERLERLFPVERRTTEDGSECLRIGGSDPMHRCPMGIERGTFEVEVYADGRVQVKYELHIPYDAQYSHELLSLLNRVNGCAGATYSIVGDVWDGMVLYARDEFYMDRLLRAFAGKVFGRIMMTAADIRDVLWDLRIMAPKFFSPEVLDQAMAEANLSPENLLRLPEVCEAPPEIEETEEAEYLAANEFFDESQIEESLPDWDEKWGDEQEFLEKFINEPVENMSGSELTILNIALQRDTVRVRTRLQQALADRKGEE